MTPKTAWLGALGLVVAALSLALYVTRRTDDTSREAASEPSAHESDPPSQPGRAHTILASPEPAGPGAPSSGAGPGSRATDAEHQPVSLPELRRLMNSDPERALRLAREQNAREPRAEAAAELAWIEVRALVNLEQFESARAAALRMQSEYPNTYFAQDVKRHLLVHPLGLPARDR